jgi:hypothetical protein
MDSEVVPCLRSGLFHLCGDAVVTRPPYVFRPEPLRRFYERSLSHGSVQRSDTSVPPRRRRNWTQLFPTPAAAAVGVSFRAHCDERVSRQARIVLAAHPTRLGESFIGLGNVPRLTSR